MFSIKKLQFILLFYFIRKIHAYYPPWRNGTSDSIIWQTRYFCKNNSDLVLSYRVQPSSYYVWINEILDTGTEITVKFDAEPSIFVNNEDITKINSNITKNKDIVNNIYTFEFVNHTQKLKEIFRVKGNTPYHQTHITSLKINGVEKCLHPDLEIFENDRNYQPSSKAHDKFCGRRKIRESTEENTFIPDRPGFWPWHAAIYINNNAKSYYICGGTLISTRLILTEKITSQVNTTKRRESMLYYSYEIWHKVKTYNTDGEQSGKLQSFVVVAQCVTVGNETVASEVLEAVLGEHSLHEKDGKQIFKVTQVIVHEDYNYRILNNDIALLKLKDEVNYNNNVQPACLWFDQTYDQNNEEDIIGTIVSSYLDVEKIQNNTSNVTKAMRVVSQSMPIVPDATCLLYQPVFYHILLNGLKFCAGPQNVTVPCKNMGNAFMVHIEDYKPTQNLFSRKTVKGPGAWYIKGMVSATLKSYDDNVEGCDPDGYAVFTDVDKYRDWIGSYMKNSHVENVFP